MVLKDKFKFKASPPVNVIFAYIFLLITDIIQKFSPI